MRFCIPPGEPPSQNQPNRIGWEGVSEIEAAIASSQALINFCAISDTSVIACISPAILVADATSRIEKKQRELTALTTIQK
jgi:hypothetical protein